jgi:hypothetical protein
MAKVTVFNVQLYDATNDKPKLSQRLATLQGAQMMGGMALDATAVQIDEVDLENGHQWTALDFKPKPPSPPTFHTTLE